MKTLFRIFLLCFVCSVLFAQGTLDLKDMRKYFEKDVSDGPWTFLQSPRTALGVGTIYTKVNDSSLVFSRPDECFTYKVLQRSQDPVNTKTFTVNKTGRFSLELGLRVANAGPITDEVNAEFKRKGVTAVKINYGEMKRNFLSLKELQDFIKSDMDGSCRGSFIKKTPERWIVLETLTASSAKLELEDTKGTQASIKAGIMKILFPSFKLNPNGEQTEVKGELALASDHIVAVKMIKAAQVPNNASQPFTLTTLPFTEYYRVFGPQ